MISVLQNKGVIIPSPTSVVIEDIDPNRIESGARLYPGTVLHGKDTFIGRNSIIGLGGGAFIQNAQIGRNCTLMQGIYRECTILDDVIVRGGAEIREGCLLEEGVELGHTVGLKQTILFPDVVLGSLINFCDALLTGGASRRNHSEVGSCMALYNFTPNGDKFASMFGDVPNGLFLNQHPIFIGGQTQIVSPVHVGFGCVIAAGTKLTRNVENNLLVSCSPSQDIETIFNPAKIRRPDQKIETTCLYISNLELLRIWYEKVRLPIFKGTYYEKLIRAGIACIQSGIEERRKRLRRFIERLHVSLEYHRQENNTTEVQSHLNAIEMSQHLVGIPVVDFDFSRIVEELRRRIDSGSDYRVAIRTLPIQLIEQTSRALARSIGCQW